MSVDTYYSVLGVSETATPSEIKAAYRDLIKQVHPDTVSTVSPYLRRIAEDKSKELTEAYSVLADTSKRRQYDRQLAALRRQSTPAPPPPQAASKSPPGPCCPKCGTPLFVTVAPGATQTSVHCPKCGIGTGSTTPQSRRRWFNWEPVGRWAAKNPVLACFVGFVIIIFIVSLLPDSSSPGDAGPVKQPTGAQASTPSNAGPVLDGRYSEYPCDPTQN